LLQGRELQEAAPAFIKSLAQPVLCLAEVQILGETPEAFWPGSLRRKMM
jgi:hypothetical protein